MENGRFGGAGIGLAKDTRPGGLLANEFSSKWQAGVRYDFGAIEPATEQVDVLRLA